MNFKFRALGRLKRGEMNKTESAYAQHLELLYKAGEIVWYKFEAIKFRLADSCFYTPDFVVMKPDGTLECHEVKGFWMDDARVKIKVASDTYPFTFLAIKKNKKQWDTERF